MSVIDWSAPPDGKPEHDWGTIVAELRSRPGEWAYVARYANHTTSGQIAEQLRKGIIEAARPPGGLSLLVAASWATGLLCLVVVVLSAVAYREAARTEDSMEGDR